MQESKYFTEKSSIFGVKFARLIAESPDKDFADFVGKIKQEYDYLHVYCYKKKDLPGFEMTAKKTPLIDLSKTSDEIFKNFDDTAKKHVKRAERNEELQIIGPDKNFQVAYGLYKKVKKNDGAKPDIKKEFTKCLLFNAYYKGKIINTMSFDGGGKYLRARHLASLRKEMGEENKVAAQAGRKMILEVCRYGKNKGYKYLDLGIINYEDPAKAGIARFKSSFGGNIVDVFVYRYENTKFRIFNKILNLINRNIS